MPTAHNNSINIQGDDYNIECGIKHFGYVYLHFMGWYVVSIV